MIHQRVADHPAAAGHEVEHAGRQMQLLVEEAGDPCADHGRDAGGLDDRRVAGDDRRRRQPGQDGVGEVPRRDHDAHAQRDVEELNLAVGLRDGRLRGPSRSISRP